MTSNSTPTTTTAVSNDPVRKTSLVPYVNLDEASPAIQEKIKILPFRRNILLTLAHSQGLSPHFLSLLGGCFDGKQRKIPMHEWQLIVLRTATILDAEYEYDVNLPVAQAYNMPQEKIEAIGCPASDVLDGKGPWTDRDRVYLRLVDEQLATYSNQEDTIQDAIKILGIEDVVEILIIIGVYATLARVIKGLRVDDDPEVPDLEEKIKTAIS